jgi:hypothetical protein
MQSNFDIRRQSDGSIDYDFYRRRAVQRHRLARQVFVRRCIGVAGRAMRTSGSAIASLLLTRRNWLRLLMRAAAIAAMPIAVAASALALKTTPDVTTVDGGSIAAALN